MGCCVLTVIVLIYVAVAAVKGFLGVAIAFTRHYQHKHESEALATIITILALTLVLATVALVPIDIFLVSSTVDQSTGLKQPWATPDKMDQITMTVQIVYYGMYVYVWMYHLGSCIHHVFKHVMVRLACLASL